MSNEPKNPQNLNVASLQLSPAEIVQKINPLNERMAEIDYARLLRIKTSGDIYEEGKVSRRSWVGNKVVDYFTLENRLHTRGKYGVSFYEFVDQFESVFSNKKYIQTMVAFYDQVRNRTRTKNAFKVLKEIYNVCISAINVFRPINAMELYARFQPNTVLDFTCGWGGRLIGAYAMDVPNYIGIDSNTDLEADYERMTAFLDRVSTNPASAKKEKKEKGKEKEKEKEKENQQNQQNQQQPTGTRHSLLFQDARTVDYASMEYDMVLTSPPYFHLERYKHSDGYDPDSSPTKLEMITEFYNPLFRATYDGLQPGGHYCLNVNKEIYDSVCVPLLGEATERIEFRKSDRNKKQNQSGNANTASCAKKYQEFIYIWHKTIILKNK